MATHSKPAPPAAPPRLLIEQFKAAHFTPEGRDDRVARGLRALEGPEPAFQLPPEAWKQIAEDPDLDEG